MQSLLELQQSAGSSFEFIERKSDLFPDEIYVFTPEGRIVELPAGATPVDFAYAVHTDIGHACVGARVDRQPIRCRSRSPAVRLSKLSPRRALARTPPAELCRQLESARQDPSLLKTLSATIRSALAVVCSITRWAEAANSPRSHRRISSANSIA